MLAEKLQDAGEVEYSERHRGRVYDLDVDVLVTGLLMALDEGVDARGVQECHLAQVDQYSFDARRGEGFLEGVGQCWAAGQVDVTADAETDDVPGEVGGVDGQAVHGRRRCASPLSPGRRIVESTRHCCAVVGWCAISRGLRRVGPAGRESRAVDLVRSRLWQAGDGSGVREVAVVCGLWPFGAGSEAWSGLGWFSADGGDDLCGDVAEFAVTVLGGLAEQVESGRGGAALLSHENPDGLVDDAAGDHRLGQLAVHLGLAHLSQADRQRGGALRRERLGVAALWSGEGGRDGG